MQPLTRGPEDGETKTMTVARPHHVCVPLSGQRQHHPARSTCADAFGVRSSPLGADMVSKSRNMSADMLFTPGLLAVMPRTICCVRSQSVRDLVTEISGGATPHRCGVAQSSSSELATQAWPSQPHSRLVVPVHVGSRLAHSGSPTHPSLQRLSTVPCNRRQRTRTGDSAWKSDRDSEPAISHASDPANGSIMILSACKLAM